MLCLWAVFKIQVCCFNKFVFYLGLDFEFLKWNYNVTRKFKIFLKGVQRENPFGRRKSMLKYAIKISGMVSESHYTDFLIILP